MVAILYSLLENAKLVAVNPTADLRRAVDAAASGETSPLPQECVGADAAAV